MKPDEKAVAENRQFRELMQLPKNTETVWTMPRCQQEMKQSGLDVATATYQIKSRYITKYETEYTIRCVWS